MKKILVSSAKITKSVLLAVFCTSFMYMRKFNRPRQLPCPPPPPPPPPLALNALKMTIPSIPNPTYGFLTGYQTILKTPIKS